MASPDQVKVKLAIRAIVLLVILTVGSTSRPPKVQAYEVDTHNLLTLIAIEQAEPQLTLKLTRDLEITSGLAEEFNALGNRRTAGAWIQFGSIDEDSDNRSKLSDLKDSPVIKAVRGVKSQKTSQTNFLIDNVNVDNYMKLVGEELEAIGYSLDKRAFIANIINIQLLLFIVIS